MGLLHGGSPFYWLRMPRLRQSKYIGYLDGGRCGERSVHRQHLVELRSEVRHSGRCPVW